ncbi:MULTISPECIES: YbjQ family protein [unclassified Uliginosibacterium]|uniref:YbjQ family protein n=1 Tax=unclassified Uliginosibacterium TaxID=2621521 RepID=UPI000C7E432F|nr:MULTISPECIES: heavy metal-binding domain-containing protein [unclassified Uliginosibacterium]MDO6386396.1 heavy metal-binding domain-containing protein [Uliginosibacterium sp. 31-12]PLK49465.1 hypothetical protein C0V76_09780 [Uliginosibacterium sp. TH139]
MELLIKLGVFLVLVTIGYWRGRRNERAHLRSLAAEEDAVADVLVFATRYPPPSAQVLDPLLVTGSAVIASDYFRFFVAGLRKIVGGNYRAYEQLLERGRRQAMVRLKQAAKARGAKHVFNVRITTSRISNSRGGEATQVEVLAVGTAFVLATGSVAESRAHYRTGPALASPENFSLFKHRFTRAWLLALVAAVIYAFVELIGDARFTHQWRYAHGAPTALFFMLACIVGLALLLWARRAKTPWSSAIVLSLLTIPALQATLYFGVLRLNSLLSHGPQQVAYKVASEGLLQPVTADLPELYFYDYADYWAAQPEGSPVHLTVLRGALGVLQYDLRPLGPQYEAWYSAQH